MAPQRLPLTAETIAKQRALEGTARPMPVEELAEGLGDSSLGPVRLQPKSRPVEQAQSFARAAPEAIDAEEPVRLLASAQQVQAAGDGVTSFLERLRSAGDVSPTAKRILQQAGPAVDVAKVGSPAMPAVRGSLGAPMPSNEQEGVSVRSTSRQEPDTSHAGRDVEFADAQQQARNIRLSAAIGRAGAGINKAISGADYDEDAYATIENGSGRPVAELVAQRDADRRKRLADPASPESRRFQSAVMKAMGGVYSPEEVAEMTAADEPFVSRYGEMAQRLSERREAATQADLMRRSAMEREDAQRAEERGYQEKQAAQGRAFQSSEAAKARAFQREMAGLNNAADLQQVQARSGAGPGGAARGVTVPGMEVAPGAAPTPDDAKKVKAANAARERLHRLTAELRALHKAKGTEFVGEAASRMGQLTTAIQLEAKTLAELGALTGPDMALMERLTGSDPSSLGASLKSIFSFGALDNTQQALSGVDQWGGELADATADTYGYQRAPGAETQRFQKDGKTYEKENGQWYEVL